MHINSVVEKTQKFINLFKILAGLNWGIHPKHLRRLYISIIRSRMDYACFLYDNAAKTHLINLDRVQNMAMRLIGGFVKSTAIHVMESELCLVPLHIRRVYLGSKFLFKSKAFSPSPVYTNIVELNANCQNYYWRSKKLPLLITIYRTFNSYNIHSSSKPEMYNLDTWVNYIDLDSVIMHDIPAIVKSKKKCDTKDIKVICSQFINDKYDNYHKIFTDASKKNEDEGIAFFDPQIGSSIKLKLNLNIPIMSAELIAIAECLSYIKSLGGKNFVILSDSKSALQHIKRCSWGYNGVPIAFVILNILKEFHKTNINVKLQWIPAHIGITGNEIVDKLAKEAIVDGHVINYLPSCSENLYRVKQYCFNLWSEYFNERSRTKGIWYRTVQPCLLQKPWFDNSNMSRSDVITSLRLRSGHFPLNSFAFLMKKVPSPNCSECGTIEDVYHILLECVRNEAERKQIEAALPYCFDFASCNSILASPNSAEAKMLYNMVQKGCKRRM
ncbi:uncharacterized protein LOC124540818 [Vanessa cardui]|uniref:uncharacterized protein LOC124540818 n=1 Tax=Vanessa cardui TaxID=171605 RepID=UPI001F140625|nr:uncharacterized protein LOC124540818 [Vanessa cardui]